MLQKKKICKGCTILKNLFSKGLCISCYKSTYSEKFKIKKTKKPIKQVSTKHSKVLERYYILRDIYLKEHPLCERCGAKNNLQLHHKKGRGKYLLEYFCTLCFNCHRWAHDNSKQAKEEGYLN